MSAPQTLRSTSRRLEIGVLLLALAAGTGLLAAAFLLSGAPRVAGELVLDEEARRLADVVERRWAELQRDPTAWEQGGAWDDAPVRWTRDEAALAIAEPIEPAAPSAPAFEALMAQAEREELVLGDAAAALGTARAALAATDDAALRARARLRAVQLAQKSGDPAVVRGEWTACLAELDGREGEAGVSCLLLAAFAAGPSLEPEQRTAARDRLIELWTSGGLLLPEPVARTERRPSGRLAITIDPALAALARELDDLGHLGVLDTEPDARLTADLEHRRAEGLRRLLETPAGDPQAPAGAGEPTGLPTDILGRQVALCAVGGGDVLAARARGAWIEGGLLTRADVEAILTRALADLDRSNGFVVDVAGDGGDAQERGALVRPRAPLSVGNTRNAGLGYSGLGYSIRHEDAEGFVARAGRRLALLRIALLALGGLAIFAGIVSHQALRRQRLLAELKARFVANVSHELRTPVTAILFATENIQDGRARTPERLARYHAQIRGEALRLSRLVDDVLDFSRLERGEGPRLNPESVDATTFARELTDAARARVEGAGIRFEGRHRLASGDVDIDVEALRRAALNLVENAVLHSGSDVIRLAIEKGRDLRLRVTDCGRGIPGDRADRVFDPFEQVEGGAGKARGAGLGLAIVREIARAHGGAIHWWSGPDGSGSVFEITVPLSTDGTNGRP